MAERTIILCYRKLIDANSATAWEKMLWQDSYKEFKMQFQLYNQEKKYHQLSEVIDSVKGAGQLHFLVSAAAVGYIRQLDEMVPDILNSLGVPFLHFGQFRFEILCADDRDIASYKIAIWFYCKPLTWHNTIANYLLVSEQKPAQAVVMETNMVAMQPALGIHSIQYN